MLKDKEKNKSVNGWVSKDTEKFVDTNNSNDIQLIKENYWINWEPTVDYEEGERLSKLEQFIVDRYSSMVVAKNTFTTEKSNCDKSYDTNTTIIKWDLNISVPIEKSVINKLEAEIGDVWIIYEIDPIWSLTDINRIQPNRIVMDYFFWEDNTWKKAIEFRKNFFKYWFAVWFEWLESKRIKIKWDNTEFNWEFLTWKSEKVLEKIQFNLWSRVLNIDNFFIDDWVNKFEDAIDCIEIETLSKYEVYNKFTWNTFFNIDKMLNWVKDLENEIIHYYNISEDIYAILVNRVMIYEWPNPYPHKKLPYFVAVLDISEKHPYGEGWIISKLRFVKPYLNDLFNVAMKQSKNSNSPPILVWSWIEFIKNQPTFWVWNIVQFEWDLNQIREFKVSPPDSSIFNTYNLLLEMVVQLIWVNTSENYSAERITKFQIWVIEQNKNKRIWIFWRPLDYAFWDMLNLRLKNIHYFLDLVTLEEIIDPNLKWKKKPTRKTILLENKKAIERLDENWNKYTEYEKLPWAYSEFELNPDSIRWIFAVKVITESTRPLLKELKKEDIKLVIEQLVQLNNSWILAEELQSIDKRWLVKSLFETYNLDLNNLLPDVESKRIEDEVNKELESIWKMTETLNSINTDILETSNEISNPWTEPINTMWNEQNITWNLNNLTPKI